MPSLAAIATIDFPNRVPQTRVKQYARELFEPSFPQVERLLNVFDSTEIINRNFCQPLSYYGELHSFKEQNNEYIKTSLKYSVKAIEQCLQNAEYTKEALTDILFVSTTGLATPSLDALIVNEMRLNSSICRTAVFGLGCAGGVAGYAKASVLAKANPNAVVLLIAVELCSLTFLRNDYSKSNFIGSSLFADGVAACIITGDNIPNTSAKSITYLGSQSKLYYDTLDVMGWEFRDQGFKVIFSQDIPSIISSNILADVSNFLAKHDLTIAEISNFIFHPGGKKILTAYEETLTITEEQLLNTRNVMNDYGNMSSPTVLYVMERFYRQGFENGFGLMLSMGPGFSSEMVLLKMENK